jgi:hypothetical protein
MNHAKSALRAPLDAFVQRGLPGQRFSWQLEDLQCCQPARQSERGTNGETRKFMALVPHPGQSYSKGRALPFDALYREPPPVRCDNLVRNV